jgi:hypothetical protein
MVPIIAIVTPQPSTPRNSTKCQIPRSLILCILANRNASVLMRTGIYPITVRLYRETPWRFSRAWAKKPAVNVAGPKKRWVWAFRNRCPETARRGFRLSNAQSRNQRDSFAAWTFYVVFHFHFEWVISMLSMSAGLKGIWSQPRTSVIHFASTKTTSSNLRPSRSSTRPVW